MYIVEALRGQSAASKPGACTEAGTVGNTMTLAIPSTDLIRQAHERCGDCRRYLGAACQENGWHECQVFDSLVYQWTREGGCQMHDKKGGE